MTDGFKQIENVSDRKLRAYLLGELDEQERLLLDQSLLADDELAERVRLSESQLIDEYVGGGLDARSAVAFQTRFLKTDARREQLGLTSALQDLAMRSFPAAVLAPMPTRNRTWRDRLHEFFALRPGPAWAAAGSFTLLLLVLGAAWYLSRQPRQSEAPIAQAPVNASSSPAPPPSQIAQVPPVASPTPQVKPAPSEPPVAVASFVLLPGALRGPGEMTRVAVPRGERAILRLSLVLENPLPGTYRAALANADGKPVTLKGGLRPHRNGQTKIIVEVPARLIQADDYQIKLSRQSDGEYESIGRYYFRALPE